MGTSHLDPVAMLSMQEQQRHGGRILEVTPMRHPRSDEEIV
jgi:hypothetical protein